MKTTKDSSWADAMDRRSSRHCSSAIEHCFCCGIQFDQSCADGPRDWPGTIFEATGNWGSTIFDPSPMERPASLMIRICDGCVIEKRGRIQETGSSLSQGLREDVVEFLERR